MIWVVRGLAALTGIYVCVLAAVTHHMSVAVAGASVPYGLVLGIATTLAVALAWMPVRLGPEAFALGWGIGLALALGVVSTGGYLLVVDAYGIAFLVLGIGALFYAMVRAFRV